MRNHCAHRRGSRYPGKPLHCRTLKGVAERGNKHTVQRIRGTNRANGGLNCPRRFDVNVESSVRERLERLLQGRETLTITQMHSAQLRRLKLINAHVAVRNTLQIVVMADDGHTVRTLVHVRLEKVDPHGQCFCKSQKRILRSLPRKTPVRKNSWGSGGEVTPRPSSIRRLVHPCCPGIRR